MLNIRYASYDKAPPGMKSAPPLYVHDRLEASGGSPPKGPHAPTRPPQPYKKPKKPKK